MIHFREYWLTRYAFEGCLGNAVKFIMTYWRTTCMVCTPNIQNLLFEFSNYLHPDIVSGRLDKSDIERHLHRHLDSRQVLSVIRHLHHIHVFL